MVDVEVIFHQAGAWLDQRPIVAVHAKPHRRSVQYSGAARLLTIQVTHQHSCD